MMLSGPICFREPTEQPKAGVFHVVEINGDRVSRITFTEIVLVQNPNYRKAILREGVSNSLVTQKAKPSVDFIKIPECLKKIRVKLQKRFFYSLHRFLRSGVHLIFERMEFYDEVNISREGGCHKSKLVTDTTKLLPLVFGESLTETTFGGNKGGDDGKATADKSTKPDLHSIVKDWNQLRVHRDRRISGFQI